MPAVLTENGFIDNVNDANQLRTTTYIENLARGHVTGVVRIFNLVRKNYSLSQQYDSTVQQIKDWNDLDSSYTIYVGQVLRVQLKKVYIPQRV